MFAGRAGPDGRRAARLAARRRLWRGRDVPRLRRPGARAAHQPHLPISRKATGRSDARRRRRSTTAASREPAKCARRPSSGAADRQGQLPPFHGEGDRTSSPTVIGDTLHAFVDPLARRVELPKLPVRPRQARRASRSSPAAPPIYAGHVAQILVRKASRACRSRSMSPRSSATASAARSPRARPLVISQSGETADTLAALRYAKAQGQQDHRRRQCRRKARWRARPTSSCRPMPAPRSASPRPRRSPTQLAVLACLRHRGGARARHDRRARRSALSAALLEAPGARCRSAERTIATLEGHRARGRGSARRAVPRPRHAPTRSRWKAR